MSPRTPIRMEMTRALSASERKVLAVVLANVVESRQVATSSPLSVVCLADFREWMPTMSTKRALDLLASIVEIQWYTNADPSQAMPIFWNVLEKGSAFVIEVDNRFREARASERMTDQFPELIGQTESEATEVLRARGLAVRIDTRDGKSPAPFQSADIRRDRANLKVEHGIVVRAYVE
ncbi:hypothetical protein ACXIVK_35760 [Paraburkholderia caledonica]